MTPLIYQCSCYSWKQLIAAALVETPSLLAQAHPTLVHIRVTATPSSGGPTIDAQLFTICCCLSQSWLLGRESAIFTSSVVVTEQLGDHARDDTSSQGSLDVAPASAFRRSTNSGSCTTRGDLMLSKEPSRLRYQSTGQWPTRRLDDACLHHIG